MSSIHDLCVNLPVSLESQSYQCSVLMSSFLVQDPFLPLHRLRTFAQRPPGHRAGKEIQPRPDRQAPLDLGLQGQGQPHHGQAVGRHRNEGGGQENDNCSGEISDSVSRTCFKAVL